MHYSFITTQRTFNFRIALICTTANGVNCFQIYIHLLQIKPNAFLVSHTEHFTLEVLKHASVSKC